MTVKSPLFDYNPYSEGLSPYQPVYEGKTTIRSVLEEISQQRKFIALSPAAVLKNASEIQLMNVGEYSRIERIAQTLEGINLYNLTAIQRIRNGVDPNIHVPCLDFKNNEVSTLQISYWNKNDVTSEYYFPEKRQYFNHLGVYNGEPLEFGMCSSCTPPWIIGWIVFFGFLCFSIYLMTLGKMFISAGSTMLMMVLFVGCIMCCFPMISGEENVNPKDQFAPHTQIQSEIESFYLGTINEFLEIIPNYFPNRKSQTIRDFSLLISKTLLETGYNELVYAVSDNGPLSHIESINKDIFENYLVIYMFLKERSLSDPGSVFNIEYIMNRLCMAFVYGLFEGSDSLYEYLKSLMTLSNSTQVTNIMGNTLIRDLKLNNLGGHSFIENSKTIVERVINASQVDKSNNNKTLNERIRNIKVMFCIKK